MRMQPITIALGAQHWLVRPLTLAQVQAIEPLLLGSTEAKAGSVASAIAILRVALGRDHATAAAALDEVEAGAGEVAGAMAQVLRLGGFLPDGGPRPGEADAGPAPAPTGLLSTPA
jgi:hypothetical protein